MRYLTHRDRFCCVHGGQVTITEIEDSSRFVIGDSSGRILLEQELLTSTIACVPPLGCPRCKVLQVVPNAPDKTRLGANRPVVLGALILTNNGPLLHSVQDQFASSQFAVLQPLFNWEIDGGSEVAMAVVKGDDPVLQYVIHAQCRLNGRELLSSRPFRILIDGAAVVTGTTDDQGVILCAVVSRINALAYIEIETEDDGVMVYGVQMTQGPITRQAMVSNLGFDPNASHAIANYFVRDGEPANRDWLGEQELAALDLERLNRQPTGERDLGIA